MKKVVAQCLLVFLLVSVLPPALAIADAEEKSIPRAASVEEKFGSGSVADGVDFRQLARGNVYYGKTQHPTQLGGNDVFYTGSVTKKEENPSPVLWEWKGEEQDANGSGDGKITLLSKYIVNSMSFGSSNSYVNSEIAAWLNNSETGFLKDTFTAAENQAIPMTEVITANFSCDGKDTELTEGAGQTWPQALQQKVYLPWGTYSGKHNGIIDYPGETGDPATVYWSAKPVLNQNMIANTVRSQYAQMKDSWGRVQYSLRSPHAVNQGQILGVSHNNPNGTVFNLNIGTAVGVRPIIKLNPESIIFASEIKRVPANRTQTASNAPDMAEGEKWSPNYKLTILGGGENDNPYSMSIAGHQSGDALAVTKGETLTLQAEAISHSGAEYSINYKVVMPVQSMRHIMDYGQIDNVSSGGMQIAIPTEKWLRSAMQTDTVDLYIWLQKNNAGNSNEASAPVHFTVSLTGGEAMALPAPKPSPLNPETAKNVYVSYPDGKMKAALFNFDDAGDFIINADLHLIEILNKNKLKGTFNVVKDYCDMTEAKAFSKRISQYDGHELASHTVSHPQLGTLTDEEFKKEMVDSKAYIETFPGRERVTGLAYSYYYKAGAKRLDMIREAGYLYSRRTDDSKNFYIPDNFYNWLPTTWVLRANSAEDEPYLTDMTKDFLTMDPEHTMRLMFIWGHATDFDSWSDPVKSKWGYLEKHCEMIGSNLNTVWSPTCQEFVDYVNAAKLLGIYQGSGSNILFDNSESAVDVWVMVNGGSVTVPAGTVKEVNPAAVEKNPDPGPPVLPPEEPDPSLEPSPSTEPSPSPEPTSTPKPQPTPIGSGSVYQFQEDSIGEAPKALEVRTTGGTSAVVQKSPHDPFITRSITAGDYQQNAENTQNKVLKIADDGISAGTAEFTVDVGAAAEQLALDWELLRHNRGMLIEAEANGVSKPIFSLDNWGNIGLMAKNRAEAIKLNTNFSAGMVTNDIWMPVGMVFSGLNSENPVLDFYLAGRYNYTASNSNPIASQPPAFEKAHFELGELLDGLDWSQDVKLKFTVPAGSDASASLILDNLRVYTPKTKIENGYYLDFEGQELGMSPRLAGLETGGYYSRHNPNLTLEDSTQITSVTLLSYDMTVQHDPQNADNHVLKGIRGEGSNEASYGALLRGIINKPEDELSLSFRVMLSGMKKHGLNFFTLFAQDGDYHGYFPDNTTITVGTSLFNIDNNGNIRGPENMWTGKTVADDTWIDVKITFDIPTAMFTLYLNGEPCGTKESAAFAEVMRSAESQMTFGFKHANAQTGQTIYYDDILLGNPPAEPTPSLALYQDEACSVPLSVLSGTVYAKREALTGNMFLAAFDEESNLLQVVQTPEDIISMELPENCARVRAFVWELEQLIPQITNVLFPTVIE